MIYVYICIQNRTEKGNKAQIREILPSSPFYLPCISTATTTPIILTMSNTLHSPPPLSPSPSPSLSPRSRSCVSSFSLGVLLCVRGYLYSLHNSHVFSYTKHSLALLLSMSFLTYFFILLLFLPIRVALFSVSFFITLPSVITQTILQFTSFSSLFNDILWFIPSLSVFLLNSVLSLEELFFSVLSQLNPLFSNILKKKPRYSPFLSFISFIKRTAFLMFFLILLRFLRVIPYIGSFIPSLWFIVDFRHFLLYKSLFSLQNRILLVLVLFFLFSYSQNTQTILITLLQIQYASIRLSREIFDTYISRIEKYRDHKEYEEIIRNTYITKKNIKDVESKEKENSAEFDEIHWENEQTAGKTNRNNNRNISNNRDEYSFLGFSIPDMFNPSLFLSNSSNSNSSLPFTSSIILSNNFKNNTLPIPLPHYSSREFVTENYFILLGFSVPFVCLFSIPLIGFCSIGIAQGASAFCLNFIISEKMKEIQQNNETFWKLEEIKRNEENKRKKDQEMEEIKKYGIEGGFHMK